jgi:hypothetical protein
LRMNSFTSVGCVKGRLTEEKQLSEVRKRFHLQPAQKIE